jgi:DNA-binding NarL/FixJ family response regulator
VKKSLLIVDDSASVRAVIRGVVELRGLEVCGEAGDGIEAIEKAKELHPDLILLDLGMPKLNGAAVASRLKQIMPQVPIILFTMFENAGNLLGRKVGVDVVLSKTDGIQLLFQRIDELLKRKPAPPEM